MLVIPYQQFVNRLALFRDGAHRTEDAQTLDVEAVVQVVEERVRRVLLTRVGVGKHSFAARTAQLPAELGQPYLVVVVEVVGHVRGAVVRLVHRFVGRVEVIEGLLPGVASGLPVVPVEDVHSLQQPVVGAQQFLFQYLRPVPGTEGHRELALPVHRVDAVVAGAHEEDEQGGAGHPVGTALVEEPALLHEVRLAFRMFLQRMVFLLDAAERRYQFLVRVLDGAVHVHQALVGVVDDAAHVRVVLSDSEEQGPAAHERFHIRFHFPEVAGQGFCQHGEQPALSPYPREAWLSRKACAFLFLCHNTE